MINRIREFLETARAGKPTDGEMATWRAASNPLQLATAALLVEAADMDSEIDTDERATMDRLLTARFGLSDEECTELVALAHDASANANQLLHFTQALKNQLSHDERIEIIEMLWEVAYADGVIHDYEAHLLRRVAGLLYVADQERGAARKRVLARMHINDPEAA